MIIVSIGREYQGLRLWASIAIFAEITGLMEYIVKSLFFFPQPAEFEVSPKCLSCCFVRVVCVLVGWGGRAFVVQYETRRTCLKYQTRRRRLRPGEKSECLPTPFRCLGHIFCHAGVFCRRRHSSSMIVRTHAPIPALHLCNKYAWNWYRYHRDRGRRGEKHTVYIHIHLYIYTIHVFIYINVVCMYVCSICVIYIYLYGSTGDVWYAIARTGPAKAERYTEPRMNASWYASMLRRTLMRLSIYISSSRCAPCPPAYTYITHTHKDVSR